MERSTPRPTHPQNTVTGTPAGRAAHAARPPVPRTVWAAFGAAVLLTAGAAAALATLLPDTGEASGTPGSAQSITVTRTATDTAGGTP